MGGISPRCNRWFGLKGVQQTAVMTVFSASRSVSTAIFLGSFRLPYEEIRDIVLQVDEERLTESLIQVRLLPARLGLPY